MPACASVTCDFPSATTPHGQKKKTSSKEAFPHRRFLYFPIFLNKKKKHVNYMEVRPQKDVSYARVRRSWPPACSDDPSAIDRLRRLSNSVGRPRCSGSEFAANGHKPVFQVYQVYQQHLPLDIIAGALSSRSLSSPPSLISTCSWSNEVGNNYNNINIKNRGWHPQLAI